MGPGRIRRRHRRHRRGARRCVAHSGSKPARLGRRGSDHRSGACPVGDRPSFDRRYLEIVMAENIPDLSREPKHRAYPELFAYIVSTLAGIDDDIAGMATISAMIHHSLRHLWTGFYRVVAPNLLRVGPYQGTLGCLEIPFGKGVCGTAAAERRAVIVPDVEKFPGHIACDGRSRSEIVLPVFGPGQELVAVFDVDSDELGKFDRADEHGLEKILA